MKNEKKLNAIILAAGKGTRMKSDTIKVLHRVGGKYILEHVIDAVNECQSKTYVVIGYQAEKVQETFKRYGLTFVKQTEQLGTGHAVQHVIPQLDKSINTTIVLAGDCPLIQGKTIRYLVDRHQQNNAAASILTTNMPDPTGYGRIIRDNGVITSICEHKDCSEKQLQIKEINSGIYVFKTSLLLKYIHTLKSENKQKEYYLTDIIHILKDKGYLIDSASSQFPEEVIGINSRQDLAQSNKALYERKRQWAMSNGVTLLDPSSTFIDSSVSIGHDTILHPFTILKGSTVIGSHCEIGPFVTLENSHVSNNENVKKSTIVR